MARCAPHVLKKRRQTRRTQLSLTLLSRARAFCFFFIPQIIVVEGGLNFLSLYQGLITIRILLSWFPQAQGVALLQPVFTVSDVYLNLFRGVVPPIGGIDISPIGAFFVLNLLQQGVASLAAAPGQPYTVHTRAPPPGTRLMRRLRGAVEQRMAAA